MTPEELIIFIILGLGFWVVLIIAIVIIPLRSYLLTGKLWILSPSRMSFIVLKGKKAQQSLFLRLTLMIGILDLIVSMIVFNRFAWEGALTIFVSSVLGIFITFGAKRVPRKNIFWRN
jgi:hypothetical protein